MEIKYINPAALHDEMLRLRQEEQMDFLECLTGMDWGEPDTAKDTPDTPRGLGVVYQLESTATGKRGQFAPPPSTGNIPNCLQCATYGKPPTSWNVKYSISMEWFSSVIPICDVFICAMIG